jgi:hypothetical protein
MGFLRGKEFLEECYFLTCDDMQSGRSLPAFQRKILPLSAGLKSEPSKQ